MSREGRLALDIGLFAALLLAFFPALTGISIHEWLSLAAFIPIVIHLAFNWDWVMRTTSRLLRKMRAASRVNLVVDVSLFVATVTVLLSGMMISQAIASALNVSLTPAYVWHLVHSLSAKTVIALTLLHLALHWRWVAGTVEAILPDTGTGNGTPVPVRAESGRPGRSG